jgi:signal transduction histidine kinase
MNGRPARPSSLKVRLTLAVVGVLAVSMFGFSLLQTALFRHALLAEFDDELAEDARALANMVEERAEGPFQIEAGALEGFDHKQGASYFEIWMDDGAVLARSPLLGGRDLERAPQAGNRPAAWTTLPDGRRGRVLSAALPPRQDEDAPAQPSGRRAIVAIARSTEEIDGALSTLRLVLWISGLTALLVAALAGVLTIRRGLAPLARLSARIASLDPANADERLPAGELPRELQPVVLKTNELLSRVAQSLARERLFSANLSHELRTPLAGLRSTLEVAASRDRAAGEYRAAIGDALAVVSQMDTLAANLLMLSRLETRQIPVARQDVALRELVEGCLSPHAPAAARRRLHIENRVPPDARFASDRDKLRIALGNLLANAVEYTAEGGRIAVDSDLARGLVLRVSDSGPPIPDESLERIFERFVRLDAARAATGEHAGIGLSLVRAVCAVLGLAAAAVNEPDGWVAFSLTQPDH